MPDSTESEPGPDKRYFDAEGRLHTWPAKKQSAARLAALKELARSFEAGKRYGELEINEILKTRHTFGDHALLRREMFDLGLLERTRDCRTYWLPQSDASQQS